MTIKITDHARGRMRKYGITEEMVIEALRSPDCILEGRFGRKIAQKVLNKKYLLRVIFEATEEGTVVVTCYRAKRARYEC